MTEEKERITVKLHRPNRLFEEWLQEWKDEAATRGSDMQYCFGKALASLKKYPLQLNSGKECAILQNFGTRLCVMLDRKLAEYKIDHPEVLEPPVIDCELSSPPLTSAKPKQSRKRKSKDNEKECSPNVSGRPQGQGNSKQTKKRDKPKPSTSSAPTRKRQTGSYVPTPRSGPYAIMLALLNASEKENFKGFMMKAELQKEAQPLCDASFTKADPGSRYTAWSSMSTIIKKGLVESVGRGKYSLTSEGKILAKKLRDADSYLNQAPSSSTETSPLQTNTNVLTCFNLSPVTSPVRNVSPRKNIYEMPGSNIGKPCTSKASGVSKQQKRLLKDLPSESIIFAPGTFDVILLVDTGEASGVGGRKGSDDSAINNLQRENVKYEIRHLKVGDFTWICRDRTTGVEVVLPYIVERKRIDDLAQSIKDGRFREQKFRLKKCGIPNVTYIVEMHGKGSHTVLPLTTLNQAAVNTEVVDGFSVKYTDNHRDTVLHLAVFTHSLVDIFKMKTLVMCSKSNLPEFTVSQDIVSLMSFEEFNKSSIKNKKWVVRDMFIKHLLQLNGVSVEKARAIVEKYPTPATLIAAFNETNDDKLLANITFGTLKRRIGPVVSQNLYRLYTNLNLE